MNAPDRYVLFHSSFSLQSTVILNDALDYAMVHKNAGDDTPSRYVVYLDHLLVKRIWGAHKLHELASPSYGHGERTALHDTALTVHLEFYLGQSVLDHRRAAKRDATTTRPL